MFRQHPRRAFFEKIENLAGIRQKLSLVRITTSFTQKPSHQGPVTSEKLRGENHFGLAKLKMTQKILG